MEVALFIFVLLSLSVLGALCLLVLECQNKRARRWSRMWSDLERSPQPATARQHPRPDRQLVLHEVSAAD